MKYLQLFESFIEETQLKLFSEDEPIDSMPIEPIEKSGPKKNYGQRITSEDFANLEEGQPVKYMGSNFTVVKNDEFVITIQNDETGEELTLNLSQFNHGGWID